MVAPTRIVGPTLAAGLSVLLAIACGDGPTDQGPVPTQLAVTTQPATTAQSGVALTQQPVVQLRDSAGADAAVAGVPVTVGGTGATLAGTTTVETDANGRAAFTDLALSGLVGSKTLQFASPGLTSAASGAIALAAGAASQLAITQQPADIAQNGLVMGRQPAVQLRDAAGNDVRQAGVDVTPAIATGGGTLNATTAVPTDANGKAQFTGLSIRGTIGARTMQFSAGTLPTVTSTSIDLRAGLAAVLAITTQPAAAAENSVPLTQQPVVQLRDADGNDVTQAGRAVTPGVVGGGATVIPSSAVSTNSTGMAVFANLAIIGTGDYELEFTAASLTPDTSATITVAAVSCALNTPGDADNDRLPNCVETNTGTFVGLLDTGTDPNDADTDDDALPDGDEILGTTLGLDLPTMGVSPLRQDVLIEYDWFDDALECAPHSHRPTPAAAAMVTAAFAASTHVNPDGSTGVNVIHDYGQGGVFTGGNLVADADGVLGQGVNGIDFQVHKNANFSTNRNGYFHYSLLPHKYDLTSLSSGQAELPGDDQIVSLYCAGSDGNVANTIMHELGHNLNLRHGGFEDANWKPNYNSVMNYLYQFPGIDTDCTPPGNGLLSYSVGTRPALNENNLDETKGVCGNPPGPGWDWNQDGDATDVGFALDINRDDGGIGDGFLQNLTDYNDWAFMILTGLSDFDGARLAPREIVSCTNPAPPRRP